MVGGLQFGREGRKEEQVDVFGYAHMDARMPSRPIEDEYDLPVRASASCRTCEWMAAYSGISARMSLSSASC